MPAVIPYLELVRRGEIREQILSAMREGARDVVDPITGLIYGEDEIRQATMVGSRFYVEAEKHDVIFQGQQARAEVLADQIDPRRSMTSYLEGFHGPSAKLARLEADGASGFVRAKASPGAVFAGSPQIPYELAVRGKGPGDLLFQVIISATTPATGEAIVTVKGIDGGIETRLRAGDKISWINPPPGASTEAVVVSDFAGGASRETDAEWGERLFDAKGSRALSGNAAHIRVWARDSSSSVDKPYVYPNGMGSGFVIVAITQKRAGVKGPLARIPSVGLMTTVVGYLTPPRSAVMPGQAKLVAVPARPQYVNVAVKLGMLSGGDVGWSDIDPWPRATSSAAVVLDTPVPTQTTFTISADTALPTVGTPRMMIWNLATSEFENLAVATIAPGAVAGTYNVSLAQAHGSAISAGMRVSPYSGRIASLSKGIVAYFDSLGTGEIVPEDDVRFAQVYRRPVAISKEPAVAGERIVDVISQALGGSIQRGSVLQMTPSSPSLPTFSVSQGPYLLVPGHVAVYPV